MENQLQCENNSAYYSKVAKCHSLRYFKPCGTNSRTRRDFERCISINSSKCFSQFISERMCDRALGMQNGRIKNAAITASSQWDKNHAPYLARLERLRRGRLMGAWSAKRNNHNQFIQVDLLRSMKITGVATQGRAEAAQWVTAFYFLYSSDGVKFARVKHWWDVVKVGLL